MPRVANNSPTYALHSTFPTLPYPTTPYHTIPSQTTLYHTIHYRTLPCDTSPRTFNIPHPTIQYNTIPSQTVLYHTIQYPTLPYHTSPHQALVLVLVPWFPRAAVGGRAPPLPLEHPTTVLGNQNIGQEITFLFHPSFLKDTFVFLAFWCMFFFVILSKI